MTNFNSVSDLSRSALLRHANAQLKLRLLTLSEEAASGLKSDVPAAMNGQMGGLAQIQDRLTMLRAHGQTTALVQSELGGLQAAMGAMEDIGIKAGAALRAAATSADNASLGVRAEEAQQDFHSTIRLLNVSVAGRFMLSGSAVTMAPLSDPASILDDVRAQVAGLTEPAQIAAAIDAWFAVPPGAAGFADAHFHGNGDAREVQIAPGETMRHNRTALDPAFRDLLKGLAIGAISADTDLGLAHEQRAALLGEAGKRVTVATSALTARRADVGLQEEAVERAMTRNSAETTALSLARSDLLVADPYETATALTQTEASLQNLYALTARLSRLSLTEYL